MAGYSAVPFAMWPACLCVKCIGWNPGASLLLSCLATTGSALQVRNAVVSRERVSLESRQPSAGYS